MRRTGTTSCTPVQIGKFVEDYATSRGYDSFEPVMPQQSTVVLSRLELLSDTIRGHLVGSGFQEIMSNILCSREELEDSLQPEEQLVEVDNVMSLAYSVLRHRVIPSLLNVEAVSSKAFYPHRTFEAGEVAVFDQSAIMGSRPHRPQSGRAHLAPGCELFGNAFLTRCAALLPWPGISTRTVRPRALYSRPLR